MVTEIVCGLLQLRFSDFEDLAACDAFAALSTGD
jgi:hypothetical protein